MASANDIFHNMVDDYRRGMTDVQIARYDDQMRRISSFRVAFYPKLLVGQGPDIATVEVLVTLVEVVKHQRAIVTHIQQNRDDIEFEIEVADVDYFEYQMRRRSPGYYTPSYARGGNLTHSQPPPIIPPLGFDVEKSKPKKIVTVKKIQREPLIGYRDFIYLKKGNHSKPLLLSRNGVPWPRYEALVATCNGDPFVAHDAPSVGCQCGIYGFSKPDHRELKTDAKMWGEIALWGKVLICPDGYRAEFAYPQNIFMLDVGTRTVRKFAEDIEKQYGVPVHLVKERQGKSASDVMKEMIEQLLQGAGDG